MLIVNMARDAMQLEELEEKVLRLLANSEGATLLDDQSLVDTLAEAKVSAIRVSSFASRHSRLVIHLRHPQLIMATLSAHGEEYWRTLCAPPPIR